MFLISTCRGDQNLGLCTTSVLAFGEPQRNGKIRFFLRQNTFFPRILPSRCGCPNASTEVVHSPRSRSPLHFDIRNTSANSLGKIISNRSAFAFRSSARALAEGLPRQDHVCKTTNESFRFHNKNFGEIRCKLDSTENPRSFEKYPTPP